MQHALQSGATARAEQRGNFIPVRKTDILDALVERGEFPDDAQRDESGRSARCWPRSIITNISTGSRS